MHGGGPLRQHRILDVIRDLSPSGSLRPIRRTRLDSSGVLLHSDQPHHSGDRESSPRTAYLIPRPPRSLRPACPDRSKDISHLDVRIGNGCHRLPDALSSVTRPVGPVSYTHLRAHETPEHL